MDTNNNIKDVEEGFYILGVESERIPEDNTNNSRTPWWVWVIIGTVVLATIIFLVVHFMGKPSNDKIVATSSSADKEDVTDIWYNNSDAKLPSCTMVSDTLIDSIHLHIFTPYNTVPALHVGPFDTTDANIVFATFAADLGYEKGKIMWSSNYKRR